MIKTVTSLSFIFLFSAIGFSQNFSFSEGDLVEKDILMEEYESASSNIINSSADSVIFQWELILLDNPEGWEYSICDYTLCYTGGELEGTMTRVEGGSTLAFLKANVYANSVGTGTYRFVVWDEAIPDATDTVTFVLTVQEGAGLINDLTRDNISATTTDQNQIRINNTANVAANFSILNISGQMVKNGIAYSNGVTVVDTDNLHTGIYFISYSDKGGVIKTDKLIIQ